jgi:transposase InsO family protein
MGRPSTFTGNCDGYQRLLATHGIRCSMSRRAHGWDNAPMESFLASLKKELVHHEDYQIWATLGFTSPTEYEQSSNP